MHKFSIEFLLEDPALGELLEEAEEGEGDACGDGRGPEVVGQAACLGRDRRSHRPLPPAPVGDEAAGPGQVEGAAAAAVMECVIGVVGRDFAVVAADTSAVQSILVHKTDEDKVMVLDSHKLMGASGEPGDRVQFTEFIQKNLHLYQFRNNIPLSTAATANFTRGELATALRKNPYYVNVLLAGYDSDVGASLYYIDYIATFHKIEKGAFGYGSYFCLSLMDKLYRPDMSVEEAVDLVDKCIKEIRLRLVVAPQNFIIKIVDKEGAREYARRAYTDSPPEAATSEAATVAA